MNNTQQDFFYTVLLKSLDSALSILNKGRDYAIQNGNEAELLDARLAPDMFSFTRQIQIFTDNIKGSMLRLAQKDAIPFEDGETSFDELIHRVNKTKEILLNIKPEDLAAAADLKIRLPWMQENMSMSGREYMQSYTIQNTLFHLVTAYAILRMKGVQLGKTDYMVGVNFDFS